MRKIIRVLLSLFQTVTAELITLANAVYAGLNGNPAYPTPPVPLPDFRKLIDDYSAAVTAALDGGAKAIAQRNALGDELQRVLRKLAQYVEIHCQDDMMT